MGTYSKVAKKHLQLYFDEFSFRYNNRRYNGVNRFEVAMCQCLV